MIADVYAQVSAPEWASPNLDGLLDILRDLSWLPEGEVAIVVPAGADDRLRAVLGQAVADTAGTARPVRLVAAG